MALSRKSRLASLSHVMYTNAVYFPNYCVYNGDTPGQLNYACINRVYYAYASVGADGHVFLHDEWADLHAPCDGFQGALGALLHMKQKYPHLQVFLSIGGPGSADIFPLVASNAVLRDRFARSAWKFAEASGLDGIDISWYPANHEQGRDFLSLLAAIRVYLPEDRYLTAALPAVKSTLQYIDLRHAAAEYLDTLNLVAYDFFGAKSSRSGHHAQLYAMRPEEPSVDSAVRYLAACGVPGKKVLVGIPLYGKSFWGVAGPGHKLRSSGKEMVEVEDVVFEYNQLPRKGTKEQLDKRAVAAQCVGGDGGFVTYDNPDSVKIKAGYCKQKGLGGLFYWSAPSDSRDPKRSLITTGFKALHSS
ncbi:hypothetical protein VTJ04DRAFT_1481 [Mycothermus thermophilus]|uniref:uncharacterized protein n=1 Tax=Humicola insolens TaxID=85995 RepID=UPI003742338D